MYITSCPLRVSLFGGSTDNPLFIEKYGRGSVISFTSNLRTYITLSQDKFGANKYNNKYIVNYSKREEVSDISEIQNELVKYTMNYFSMPPVQINMTSDIYSNGSGLASSSSYLISLIKSICMFKNIKMSEVEICKIAYEIELMFNPLCGYQDPYGCGVGGFKKIEFYPQNKIKYEFLPTKIFEIYDMHLIYTGITRSSTNVLEDVSKNIDKIEPLFQTVETAYNSLIKEEYGIFLELLNQSWEQKKNTSSVITENNLIREIDGQLKNNKTVLAHKLCGAGNGGFFLVFSEKNNLNIPYKCVKIDLLLNGVEGIQI